MNKEIVPSLLSANFYNLSNELNILFESDIKYLHLDVMDGMFVPNISFGMPVIKNLKKHIGNKFIFDTHLMVQNPERYISDFKNVGADILTIHKEATDKIEDAIYAIKNEKMKVGIAINPETDVKELNDFLDKVDLVLVMSVHPGFGGQSFIDVLDKVKYLKDCKMKYEYNYVIEIDGGINIENIKKVSEAGVDMIVAGSAVFNGDIKENINKLMTPLITPLF